MGGEEPPQTTLITEADNSKMRLRLQQVTVRPVLTGTEPGAVFAFRPCLGFTPLSYARTVRRRPYKNDVIRREVAVDLQTPNTQV